MKVLAPLIYQCTKVFRPHETVKTVETSWVRGCTQLKLDVNESGFVEKLLRAYIALFLLASLGTNAIAAGQLPALRRYRDLKVYSTSTPDKNQPERIVAQTQFVNEGTIPLKIKAQLGACQALSFKGAQFEDTVAPGQSKIWQWSFVASAELQQRQIITGSINV